MPIHWRDFQKRLLAGGEAKRERQEQEQKLMQELILKPILAAEIKKRYEPAKPTKWVPTTMKEALEFERLKKEVVDDKPITAKELLGIIGRVDSPERAFPRREIEEVSLLEVGRAGGGQVLTPPGATFRGGRILGPEGRRIGEFLPGYEPRRATETFPSLLGQRFGVTEEEARGGLGFPKPTEEKLTQKEKYVLYNIRRLKQKNAAIEDITEYIISEKLSPDLPIFQEELEGYTPAERKGFFGRFLR